MCSSEHTNLRFRKLLKLQPGLICISDIGCVKPKVPLLDYARISEGWMAEKNPRQKWSISYVWEHFLVPEHQVPIWLGFKFIINGKSLMFHWFYWYVEFMYQSQIQKSLKFRRFYWHFDPWDFHGIWELLILAYTCDKKLLEPMEQAPGRWTRASPVTGYFFQKSA